MFQQQKSITITRDAFLFFNSSPAGNRTPILGSEDLCIIRYTTEPCFKDNIEDGSEIPATFFH